MSVQGKTTVKSYFETGDKPTQAQFGDLIDSYQDYSDILYAIVTATQAGQTGIVEIKGSAEVSTLPTGAIGRAVIAAANVTAAASALGFSNVGREIVYALTTAAAQQRIGGGTVGRGIFEAVTTASAQSIIGSIIAATTAESQAGTSTTTFISPSTQKAAAGFAKASAVIDGSGSATLLGGHNIANVTRNGAGDYSITFLVAMPSSNYGISGVAAVRSDNNSVVICPKSAAAVSAGGFRFETRQLGSNTNADTNYIAVQVFGSAA